MLNFSKSANKHDRGHALIVGGSIEMAGAGRLASVNALRVGAGLVTLASPRDAMMVNSLASPSLMHATASNAEELAAVIETRKPTAILIGPGLALSAQSKTLVLEAVNARVDLVIDAGGLSAFAGDQDMLFGRIHETLRFKDSQTVPQSFILTPHPGEFIRLFPGVSAQLSDDELVALARKCGCYLLLKGFGEGSRLATPDGTFVRLKAGPKWLATAGTGDVLAGLITGLLAQDMAALEAVSTAVDLHSAAADQLGPYLTSADMENAVWQVLKART